MGLSAGTAWVDVMPNLSNFSSGLVGQMSGHKKAFVVGGALIGGALIAGLVSTLKAGLGEAMEHEKVIAALSNAIKSTGNAANISVPHVEALATKLGDLAGVDDEAILAAAGWTATFKNIKNEGPGANAIFDRAVTTMVDLAGAQAIAKGSTINLSSANTMLSKALNDPVKGLTALGRAGVQFSDGQKKTIKGMVENGNILGAQKLILKEVESQVGGAAKAYGDTLPGKIGKAKEAWNNLRGDLAAALIPTLTTLAEKLGQMIAFLQRHPTLVKALAIAIGVLAVAMIAASVAATIMTLATIPISLPILAIIAAVALLGIGLALLWVKSETFRAIVTTAFNAVKTVGTAAFNAVKSAIGFMIDKGTAAIAKVGAFITKVGQVAAGPFNTVKAAVGFLIDKVGAAIAKVGAFITKVGNVVAGGFNAVKTVVGDVIEKVGKAIAKVGDFITKVGNVVAGPFNTVKDAVSAIVGFLGSAVGLVKDLASAIRNLPSLPNMPDINPFAKGGIVTRPTIALIGEAGPEAVVPLNRLSSLSGAGISGRALGSMRSGGGGVTVENMNIRTAVDIDLVAAALYRKALATG